MGLEGSPVPSTPQAGSTSSPHPLAHLTALTAPASPSPLYLLPSLGHLWPPRVFILLQEPIFLSESIEATSSSPDLDTGKEGNIGLGPSFSNSWPDVLLSVSAVMTKLAKQAPQKSQWVLGTSLHQAGERSLASIPKPRGSLAGSLSHTELASMEWFYQPHIKAKVRKSWSPMEVRGLSLQCTCVT